ncbi:MAG: EAL domain-containing protein [Actinobacteria bacterium]|nr:MAG: EAL domain-containing protein [Actinomycetota bacterium]
MNDATWGEPQSRRRTTLDQGDGAPLDKLAAIRDAGPPLLLVDRNSTVVLASAAAQRLWPRSPEGRELRDLFDLPDIGGLCAAVSAGASWGGYVDTSDAVHRTLECLCAPVGADAGSDASICCLSLTDRTVEVQRIAELEAAHQRSLALLDAMPDLLFRISSDLTFLDYRDPTTRGIDVPPDQFLGRRLDDFLPPEIVALVEPNLLKTLATDQVVTYPSFYDYEDGRHTFDNRVVKSGAAEVVLICRDTTEQTRAENELRRNQARFQRIVQFSREYTSITDEHNVITFISAPVERVLGYTPDELVGTNAMDLIHPDDLAAGSDANRQTLNRDGVVPPPLRIRLRHKSGEWRVFETTAKPLFDDELVGGVLTHCRDITDYVDVEETLRQSVTKLDAILETAADGIVTFSADGGIESMNGAAQQMFGTSELSVLRKNIGELLTPAGRSAVLDVLERAAKGDADALAALSDDMEGLRSDGSTFPVTLSMSHLRLGGNDLFTAIIRDMSERNALQRQLEYQATHDALTGLPNRSLFHANLERAIRQTVVSGKSLSVLFMDLDRFKNVNDSLGHALGDQLLCAVANRLTGTLRGDGTVARFGGDEFLILCELDQPHEVYPIANRLLESLRRPFEVGNEEVVLGASAGIAMYDPRIGSDVGTLIRNADVALYRAKEKGRSRYEVFDASVHARSQQRLAIETALRHAIARDELRTFYQPIYCLATNQFIGAEVLVRWQNDGRLMAPSNFIDIAEESGLILEIGAWILHDACRQVHEWQQRPELSTLGISINVSGRQLDQPDYPQRVGETLESTKINPSTVTLEITETTLIYDDPRTVRQLNALKELGVKIAIDDFGTGYSSIGYLRHLPIDTIKIDRSFISQLEHDHQTTAIVNTITTLAHTLGMKVVAEGVENVRQLEILRSAGCDWVQGFFFARPASAADIKSVLLSHPDGLTYPMAAGIALPAP